MLTDRLHRTLNIHGQFHIKSPLKLMDRVSEAGVATLESLLKGGKGGVQSSWVVLIPAISLTSGHFICDDEGWSIRFCNSLMTLVDCIFATNIIWKSETLTWKDSEKWPAMCGSSSNFLPVPRLDLDCPSTSQSKNHTYGLVNLRLCTENTDNCNTQPIINFSEYQH